MRLCGHPRVPNPARRMAVSTPPALCAGRLSRTRTSPGCRAGASLLYLPAYSPDLNPIEQVFAKLKALLRKAAVRTKDTLWATIGTLLDAFTPDECVNYLANCGYELV